MLASSIQQCESTPSMHTPPLSWTLHMVLYICQWYSLNSSHLLLPPLCPKSVLYVHVSIPALQIGSSVHFSRFHLYALKYEVFFFSWFTSLSVTGSRVTHLTRTDSNEFLFYGWVIFHCIYVPQLLYLSANGHLDYFPVLAIVKQCWNEQWGTCVFFKYGFLAVYAQ